jgi:hypothetical protein
MTISQLITELQKLQAEHGDLPVTYKNWDDFQSAPTPILVEQVEPERGKYVSNQSFEGPHIHLS